MSRVFRSCGLRTLGSTRTCPTMLPVAGVVPGPLSNMQMSLVRRALRPGAHTVRSSRLEQLRLSKGHQPFTVSFTPGRGSGCPPRFRSMSHRFTIGVEEEFQIVDPSTWALRSHVSELLATGSASLGDQIKREMHQSIVEVGTPICADVLQLEHEMLRMRGELCAAADRAGLAVAAAGTHPFSNWIDQVISPGERYEHIVEELQQLARSLLIFGMHVHVAVPDHNTAIDLMNAARYFLPHLLALSTSSPFWMGRNTGLKSYRTTIFRRFPRTGIPDHFGSWGEYESYVNLLVELHCMEDAKKIWWDIRPHPTFGTLEFRICDVPTRVEETLALAALV